MRDLTGKLRTTVSAQAIDAEIGGGGYICGFNQAPDGWMIMSPDVVHAYIRGPSDKKWRSYFTADNLPVEEYEGAGSVYAPDGSGGPAMLAPSNSQIVWAYRNGYWWKSTDRGATLTKLTALGPFYIKANTGPQRYANPLIDIHPTNPDIVIWGTNHYASDTTKSGAFFTFTGGAGATKVLGLADPIARSGVPGRTLVHIDPGQPATAYAHVEGTGLYRCDTFPSASGWTLISGSPLSCQQMTVLPDGTLFIACGGPGTVLSNGEDIYRRTRAGTATYLKSLVGGSGASVVAANPANTNIIFAANGDGALHVTFDGGATAFKRYDGFAAEPAQQVGSGEIAWLSNQGAKALVMGQLAFDKITANRMIAGHGLGISWTNAPTASGGAIVWHDFTAGLEEKVARCGYHIPGESVMLGSWDYAFCHMDRQGDYSNIPIQPPRNSTIALTIAMRIDGAQDDPNYLISAIGLQQRNTVESFDKGRTWSIVPNQTGQGMSGAVACNRRLNSIIIDTNNGKGWYSLDGWATKAAIKLDGSTDTTHFINAHFNPRKPIAADKTRAGAFALVVASSGDNPFNAHKGLQITLDGGATWTRTIIGPIGSNLPGWNTSTNDPRDFWRCQIEAVPGFTKEWVYTPHAAEGYPADFLMHITNDDTVARLGANVTNVACFDFGPVAPGQTRPSVCFYGKVNGVPGAYYSEDWFATDPILMKRVVLKNLTSPQAVLCDKDQLGVAYFGGIGWERLTLGQKLTVRA